MVLRLFVLVLALLAGGKVAWQEHAYRSALRDTVASVFREQAVRACELDSRTLKLNIPSEAWRHVQTVRVEVRSSDTDPWPWASSSQSASRHGRYGHPLLVLAVPTRDGEIACTFDAVTSTATVERT